MEYGHTGRGRRGKLIRILLLLVMAVCLLKIGQAHYISVENEKQQKQLAETREANGNNGTNQQAEIDEAETAEPTADEPDARRAEKEASGTKKETSEPETERAEPETAAKSEQAMGQGEAGETAGPEQGNTQEEFAEPVILDKYAALYEQNSDLAGWLSIDGMVINYPVMQCGDDEYYLHHDFYGNDSKYGCLYVRGSADIHTPGTNFIIYGHNMKDGSMFGDLDLYKEESFFREHSFISFDTLYEERTYEIVSVFLSQVYEEEADVFKYYRFYQADTQREFDDFYDNIKEMSLYDTGVEAEFGDTFLTLSTCAYHVADGRLVVVAKRI